MAARGFFDTLASRSNEDKEKLMLTSPEYIAAHLRDLAPEVGSKAEAIALSLIHI